VVEIEIEIEIEQRPDRVRILCQRLPVAHPFVLTQDSDRRFVSALTCGAPVCADTESGGGPGWSAMSGPFEPVGAHNKLVLWRS